MAVRLKEHYNTENDYDRARILRRNATPQEQKLWLALRGEAKKYNIKFRRQHVLHPYIVDLVCLKARLVIEIDGYSHDLPQNKDGKRAEEIKQAGYDILRFSNEDVDKNTEGIVAVILRETMRKITGPHPPSPTPAREGRGSLTLIVCVGFMKRSVRIANHSTSISLEPEFWDELRAFAAVDGVTLNQLIAQVDAGRAGNLSSSLRLYVLKRLKAQN